MASALAASVKFMPNPIPPARNALLYKATEATIHPMTEMAISEYTVIMTANTCPPSSSSVPNSSAKSHPRQQSQPNAIMPITMDAIPIAWYAIFAVSILYSHRQAIFQIPSPLLQQWPGKPPITRLAPMCRFVGALVLSVHAFRPFRFASSLFLLLIISFQAT